MPFEHEVLAEGVELYLGDCLEVLPLLPDGSVDAILTDIPYGTTECRWDEIIPFDPMWREVERVNKGVFVTTASQPFTSKLIMSNLQHFRYCMVWDKKAPTGHLDANRKPMKRHEDVCVFSSKTSTYNPQMQTRGRARWKGGGIEPGGAAYRVHDLNSSYNNLYYPTSIIEISNAKREKDDDKRHPTKKPVDLYRYLVLTYTNPGDTVLDFTMGSGTTGVACIQLGRRFIGIELNERYYAIARKRITDALKQPLLMS